MMDDWFSNKLIINDFKYIHPLNCYFNLTTFFLHFPQLHSFKTRTKGSFKSRNGVWPQNLRSHRALCLIFLKIGVFWSFKAIFPVTFYAWISYRGAASINEKNEKVYTFCFGRHKDFRSSQGENREILLIIQ